MVLPGGLHPFLFHRRAKAHGQPGQRIDGAIQEFAHLSTRAAAFVAGESLRGIGKHELVALLDGFTTLQDVDEHILSLSIPSVGFR